MWAAADAREWRHKAQRAEAAGFDVLLVADHLTDGMFASLAPLVSAADALPAGNGLLQEEVAAGLDPWTRELLSARRGTGAAARRRGWYRRA